MSSRTAPPIHAQGKNTGATTSKITSTSGRPNPDTSAIAAMDAARSEESGLVRQAEQVGREAILKSSVQPVVPLEVSAAAVTRSVGLPGRKHPAQVAPCLRQVDRRL